MYQNNKPLGLQALKKVQDKNTEILGNIVFFLIDPKNKATNEELNTIKETIAGLKKINIICTQKLAKNI